MRNLDQSKAAVGSISFLTFSVKINAFVLSVNAMQLLQRRICATLVLRRYKEFNEGEICKKNFKILRN